MLIRNESQTQVSNEAVAELYPILKKYCLRVTRNTWDAEDLAHDTIAKTLRFCHKNSLAKDEKTISLQLMMTIARNHWIDHVRKERSQPMEQLSEPRAKEVPLDLLLEGTDSLIEQLTPKQLLVYVMKDIFGYTLADIAQLLETTDTTVKSLLHRARQNMAAGSESPSSEPYWQHIEMEGFRKLLLTAIRLEKPELLKQLAFLVMQEPIRNVMPLPISRTSHTPTMSMRLCAA